jgi:hypothetical protein
MAMGTYSGVIDDDKRPRPDEPDGAAWNDLLDDLLAPLRWN